MNSKPTPIRSGSYKTNNQSSQGNNGARRRLRIWMLFMVLFLGWAIYTFIMQSIHLAEKKEELAQHQVQKQKADAAFAQSQSEVKRLEDPEYIGQVARKQYGMYLPGETPIWATEATDSK